MIVDRTPQQNPSVEFSRPGLSFDAGRYGGYNPLFAGNQPAISRASDWNWLSLYFSTAQSALQSGAVATGGRVSRLSVYGLTLPDMTQGSVLFAGASGLVSQNNASFFWDNANTKLKLTGNPSDGLLGTFFSGNEQIRLTQRLSGDGLVNSLTSGGDLRLFDPVHNYQTDLTFYSFGCSLEFNCNLGASGSIFEFHGVQQSTLYAGSQYSAILSLVTATDSIHEIHVRPVQDNDGIILNYPTNGIPVIYTDTVSGTSTVLDLGCFRTRMFRMEQGSPNFYFRYTGSATNQNVRITLEDNQFATTKAQIIYAGNNGAGSRYFGFINSAADYTTIASDHFILQNLAFGATYLDASGSTTLELAVSAAVSVGVRTATPRRTVDILDATSAAQLRLTYTDNTTYCDLRADNSGNFFLTPTGSSVIVNAPSSEIRITGNATNQTIIGSYYDNNTTLKGRILYAGSNGAGSRYFGFINSNADYMAISSANTIRFLDASFNESFRIDANLTFSPKVTLATNMTTGFINIPGAAGAPSGTPATTVGFPLYYDSTNNIFYVYNGSWRGVAVA